MKLPLYQVDAFAGEVFRGNPAAVCPLPDWLPAETMQAIAAENNLSETAFLVGHAGEYEIRWFTPAVEVDLCGHATLASAYVVFHSLEPGLRAVEFHSKSGSLVVRQKGDLLAMDFPSLPPAPAEPPPGLREALGGRPTEIQRAKAFLVVYASEQEVRQLSPDFARLARVDGYGVIVTAPGQNADFVSRFFAPQSGVAEDPVTGSAHCTLVPYWASRLGKTQLHAMQVSKRGGELQCELAGDRVHMAGRAIRYLEGTIYV